MTHTPQLIRRKAQIEEQMRELARSKRHATSLYLDLEWQLNKISYALARSHYRHNYQSWINTGGIKEQED